MRDDGPGTHMAVTLSHCRRGYVNFNRYRTKERHTSVGTLISCRSGSIRWAGGSRLEGSLCVTFLSLGQST